MKLSSGLLAAVLLLLAVPVSAQTLGELAKKEQERRKTAPPAAKTYTNDDLKKMPPPPPPAAAGDSSAKAGDPAKPGDEKTDPAKPADDKAKDDKGKDDKPKDEAFWRARITTARESLRQNEAFRDALQTQINSLSADFAGRDDPFQRATIADDRQKKIAELARVNGEIERATKQIADIEEEARRANVPPGWLR
jgi:type IV secretory pathway VirB10-like protein